MHYKLFVVSEDTDIEEQLEPFQEGSDENLPPELLEFVIKYDKEDFDKLSKEEQEEVKYDFEELNGNYGYFTNLNGYWDWYVIGGRWYSEIFIKKGNEVIKTDQAKIKDIDWDMTTTQAFASLIDGKWTSHEEHTSKEIYNNYIKDLDPNLYLTVVDCHI